jgi:hypothetical protein
MEKRVPLSRSRWQMCCTSTTRSKLLTSISGQCARERRDRSAARWCRPRQAVEASLARRPAPRASSPAWPSVNMTPCLTDGVHSAVIAPAFSHSTIGYTAGAARGARKCLRVELGRGLA